MASTAFAFPGAMMEKALADPELKARADEILKAGKRAAPADAATTLFEPVPIFNATSQYISTSGPHEWVAPGPNDLRGPCPGLNAFANHGYIPHNGYATISQFVEATENVVGMGPLLAIFLSVLGAVLDGDGTAWSIGGTPGPGIGGLLARSGHGISGSHNKYVPIYS